MNVELQGSIGNVTRAELVSLPKWQNCESKSKNFKESTPGYRNDNIIS